MRAETADVVVVGAGVVGAAVAYYATQAGLTVQVLDRGPLAGGTSSAGEGNLLISDKQPGPELELALLSGRLWRQLGSVPFGDADVASAVELEPKGGLVVAGDEPTLRALARFAEQQRAAGVEAEALDPPGLAHDEPHLARDLAGGFRYPQDQQVQPMLATATLLALARAAGARVHTERAVLALRRTGERVVGVRTHQGDITAAAVVNAAGTWAGAVAELAGVRVPVAPRRGFILVTEPLPRLVRRKVYLADYVANVASDDAGLQTAAVVEGTRAGTVLIGSSRERVGFDRSWSPPAVAALASGAVRLFPALADVAILRAYHGFRPYCPDHLPVIGPDPRAPGLWHAAGHEGAGIGLAPATGALLAAALTGAEPPVRLHPFRPERFDEAA